MVEQQYTVVPVKRRALGHHWACLVMVIGLVSSVMVSAAPVEELVSLYPKSQLVDAVEDAAPATHQVMLGALENVNSRVTPEDSRWVAGIKGRYTYEVLDERRSDKVFSYFARQVRDQGQVLFECAGRVCGSSNYWANTVFGQRIIYGPQEDQHYMMALLKDHYLAVYVARRATGKVYVHLETIEVSDGMVRDAGLMGLALKNARTIRVSELADEGVFAAIAEALAANQSLSVYLVMHDARRRGETVQQALERTRAQAAQYGEQLIARGIEADRVQAFGVGPLAPLDGEGQGNGQLPRLEIVPASAGR